MTKNHENLLSHQARTLWGKSGPRDSDLWLPLYAHLADTAAIAEILWDQWVPLGAKKSIINGIINKPIDYGVKESAELLRHMIKLLAILHDLGKAIPAFQAAYNAHFRDSNGAFLAEYVESVGLRLPIKLLKPNGIQHSLASFGILSRHGWDVSFSAIVGSHHGNPHSTSDIEKVETSFSDNTGFKDKSWVAVQDELVKWGESFVSQDAISTIKQIKLSRAAQILLTAILIMADWIASDEQLFPLIRIGEQTVSSEKRASEAWENLDLEPYQGFDAVQQLVSVADIYKLHFSINEPYPVQLALLNAVEKTTEPGIVIVEAPMGEGKTEAALAAAELLAEKTGRSGIFFALPTQATSDGIFPRILQWVRTLKGYRSVRLVHGKSQFNKDFQGLGFSSTKVNEGDDDIFVSEWASGRKRSLLNDFVVGTIDQVLMAGLKQKHIMLRHLGLANKVVIIDECHAYDTYMNQYLCKTLNWLGTYQVPVIVLSATLPIDRRKALVDAYLNNEPRTIVIDPLFDVETETETLPIWAQDVGYPLITYTQAGEVMSKAPSASARKLTVAIEYLDDKDIVLQLQESLKYGGCAGVIVNTVTRAQNLAHELTDAFGEAEVVLIHSRFTAPERINIESKVRGHLGPQSKERPERMVVVGTQVLEQSLDIDFDILVTDICPMDLLIQRIGRLHRHEREERPTLLEQARCYVTGIEGAGEFNKGSKLIYGEYLLINTQILLPEQIILPDDISKLVQSAYDGKGLKVPEELQDEYNRAKNEYEKKIAEAVGKAKAFQIGKPELGTFGLLPTIVDLLDTDISDKDPSGKRAEATVRDSADSVQVLIVQKKKDGTYCLPQWNPQIITHQLPEDFTNNNRLAQSVAQNTVTLPPSMTTPWLIDKVIEAFERDCCENIPPQWQMSPWLKDELFLILDEKFEAELYGFKLHYDGRYGLSVEHMSRKDGGV